ncbi:MAG: hypothetical protein Q8N17_13020 [Burkholderiaceae bacterium]|nr:hypothetical protein [Burkholderiaceae bacterium]
MKQLGCGNRSARCNAQLMSEGGRVGGNLVKSRDQAQGCQRVIGSAARCRFNFPHALAGNICCLKCARSRHLLRPLKPFYLVLIVEDEHENKIDGALEFIATECCKSHISTSCISVFFRPFASEMYDFERLNRASALLRKE